MAAAKETRVEVPKARGGLLVVDDEPFLREAVAASLRFLGFGVTTAETAADALRLARDQAFDLMILDVMLPDGDGFEVVRRLRRTMPSGPPGAGAAAGRVLRFADVELDLQTYEVRRAGHPIELSPTEFRLLRYLMLNPGRVLTRAQLLDHVWDYDFRGSSAVVSTYVAYLRRKLARYGPDVIHTQRAVGYCLRLPRG
jgi:two-component system, OmpR family, response regulator